MDATAETAIMHLGCKDQSNRWMQQLTLLSCIWKCKQTAANTKHKNARNTVAFYLKSEFGFSPQDASALSGAVEDDGRQVRIVSRAHEEEDVAPFAPFKLKKTNES